MNRGKRVVGGVAKKDLCYCGGNLGEGVGGGFRGFWGFGGLGGLGGLGRLGVEEGLLILGFWGDCSD